MANQPILKGIVNSFSLISFAKSHGRMQVGEFTNSDTNETFKSCIFTHPESGERCFVAFSSNLGELTPKEISERAKDLQVVELEGGHFSLCAVGNSAWQDVDLGL